MHIVFTEIILFSIIAFNFSMGLFVFIKNPRSLVNQSFSIFIAGICVWASGLIMLVETRSFQVSDKITIYGFIIALFGFTLFARVFPSQQKIRSRFYSFFAPLVFLALITPFNLIIENVIFHSDGQIQPINGPLFPIFGIILVFYVLTGFFFLVRTYRKSIGLARLQMNYLLFGLLVFLSAAIVFDLILPAFGIFRLNFIGPISSIVFTAITAYAIVKHELMGILSVIQKSLIYIFLFGIIVGTYIIIIQFLGYFLRELTDIRSIVSAGITMVFGILFFHPVENYFRKISDPIFFKDHYDYADALHKLSVILHTNITKADIVNYSSAMLEEVLKPEWVRFDFSKEETRIHAEGKSISLPIIFQGEKIGELVLGPKKSGDFYNSSDMKLLKTFVYQAAVALEKGRLYEKVEEYNAHLEHLVDKRTKEIKKLQEEQRQEMFDISHNLQTPLAVIKCELELFADSFPENEKIYKVRKSINKVSQFIRNLLHLAKLENATFEVELSPLNFTALIKENVEYFEVMIEEEGIKLVSHITSGKVFILGNKRLLTELLTNLINNSIKYRAPDKDSAITISLVEEEKDARLTISDNGIGISEKDLPHIFSRFYRGFQKKNIKGTGLGLAISKKIVEKHNGKIFASSSEGQTSFTVIFSKIKK